MSDTIAAIATARAPSAIGILRLTGEDTVSVLDQVFRPKGLPMSARSTRAMVLGDVLDRTGRMGQVVVKDDILGVLNLTVHTQQRGCVAVDGLGTRTEAEQAALCGLGFIPSQSDNDTGQARVFLAQADFLTLL